MHFFNKEEGGRKIENTLTGSGHDNAYIKQYNLCGECHGLNYNNRHMLSSTESQTLGQNTLFFGATVLASWIPGANSWMYANSAIRLGQMTNSLKAITLANTATGIKKTSDAAKAFGRWSKVRAQSGIRATQQYYYQGATAVGAEGVRRGVEFTQGYLVDGPANTIPSATGAIISKTKDYLEWLSKQ